MERCSMLLWGGACDIVSLTRMLLFKGSMGVPVHCVGFRVKCRPMTICDPQLRVIFLQVSNLRKVL